MRPLHPGRNSIQFADIKVSIARICVHFHPNIKFFGTFYLFANNCFPQNQHFLVCTSQSATTKLTVFTVGSYYVFGKKAHFVGETLPKTWNLRNLYFSSYLIINSFLCKHMGTIPGTWYLVPGTRYLVLWQPFCRFSSYWTLSAI